MESNSTSLPPIYETGSSTEAPQQKQTLREAIETEIERPGTVGKARPYGVAKPRRVVIRAKITHD